MINGGFFINLDSTFNGSEMDKKEVKVTAQGSLGILALGSKGVRIWRKAVEEEKKNKRNDKKNDKKA